MAVRDIIQAAGGSAATSAAVYVEDVFSTYLYTGNADALTINNGIDLATKGGLVWTKSRSGAIPHYLVDTERGRTQFLRTASIISSLTDNTQLSSFNSNGYSLTAGELNVINTTTNEVSWTFAKQPKFFDIVTYTGNGANRTIAHSLNATPGMIIVKRTDANAGWQVYHNGLTSAANAIQLHSTAAQASATTVWNSTAPTSSVFSVGTDATVNASGGTYVAYLFAESNSGGFGAAGTDSVVSCGSYTGNGSESGPTVTLGWEPQFVIVKMSSYTGAWNIFDNMRGIPTGSADPYLLANTTAAEATTNGDLIDLTPTGFVIKSTNAQVNTSSGTYIYLAIRRGPMKTPTDATKVFAPVAYTGDNTATRILTSGFPIDLVMSADRSAPNTDLFDRLRGIRAGTPNLYTASTAGESPDVYGILTMDGLQTGDGTVRFNNSTGTSYVDYFFRRAPGFMDCVCYNGTGSNPTSHNHSLGVTPELIIVKNRSSLISTDWAVYCSAASGTLKLNSTSAQSGSRWGIKSATNTTFVTDNDGTTNNAAYSYVAYLFATCAGVSKVGSYTGNGSSQTINCGFASGARFVLIKRTDSTGDWYVWDTARGIVSANDPHLSLNSTAAEVTTDDTIDPASSGFIVNQVSATNVNVSSATYIYLAIA